MENVTSSSVKQFNNGIFESYQNGIIERAILLDLIGNPNFDVFLSIREYNHPNYMLNIDIATDEPLSISSDTAEAIGDRVGDYLKEKGLFTEINIDSDSIDWFYVTINGEVY